jgi:ABC-type multidrug transport system permease subunit
VTLNLPLIRLLVVKDWQLFQKQLAAYVLGGIVALALLGLARPWAFYLGSLLLIIVLVAGSCMSISNSLLVERKEQTLAFVMSLPVSPLDFTLAKMAGNLLTFGVPYLVLLIGTLVVILTTPLPDGLVVFSVLLYGHILVAYCVSLLVAMQVESEGWNVFAMIACNLLINPLIMLLGQIDAIAKPAGGETIVWSLPAVAILSAQLLLSLAALAFTLWWHGRKAAFY